MTLRTVIGILACALLVSACRQTPSPQPQEPDPVPRGLSTIEGVLEGWTMGNAFVTLTGGYGVEGDGQTETLTVMEPTYTGEIEEDGTFSVDLTSEPVAEGDLFALGCTADSPNVAVLSIGLVSQAGTVTSLDDVIADITLRPNPEFFPAAMWVYVEEDYSYSGTCDGSNNLLSLTEVDVEFVAGWNAVVVERLTFGARMSTAEIPDDYTWKPAY